MGQSNTVSSLQARLSKTTILVFLGLIGFSNSGMSQDDSAWWKNLFRPKNTPCDSSAVIPMTPPHTMQNLNAVPAESSDTVERPTNMEDLKTNGGERKIERKEGHYTLTWDPRMAELDSAWKEKEHPLMGYRVQLFSGNLQQAREFRSRARKKTELPLYLSSMPPNYRITLGDFRNKWDAQNEKQQWLEMFPLSLVIPMEIELPGLDISP